MKHLHVIAIAVVALLMTSSGAIVLVRKLSGPVNFDLRFENLPDVKFAMYEEGTAFARYSTVQGDSSKYDCQFVEKILSVEPQVQLSKSEALRLLRFVATELSAIENIDLVLYHWCVVDEDVLKATAEIKNLSCLDISEGKLSQREVEILLSIENLHYLRVRRQNFADESLTALLSQFDGKVVVSDIERGEW